MPAVAAVAAAATSTIAAKAAVAPACPTASPQSLNSAPLLAPAIFALASYRYKDVITDRCTKILEVNKPSSSSSFVVHNSSLPSPPILSIGASSKRPHQLHAFSSREKPFSHLSALSALLFGGQDGLLYGAPKLPRQRRTPKPPRAAYKDNFFSFKYPVLAEKPEWWWRTLACVPYLIALQMSSTGFFLQPFLEQYEFLGNLIYFIPGAIKRFPDWFTVVYFFCCLAIVKNKDWPHFFRFHLIMGMLLETALQLVWFTSNFMPLIHINGTFGMHYWAGVGFAFILILMQCVRCALNGDYVHIPIISDAAYIHTLFNMGGFQRPF